MRMPNIKEESEGGPARERPSAEGGVAQTAGEGTLPGQGLQGEEGGGAEDQEGLRQGVAGQGGLRRLLRQEPGAGEPAPQDRPGQRQPGATSPEREDLQVGGGAGPGGHRRAGGGG